MIRDGLTKEQWSDVATLGSLAVTFLVMFAFELKRTFRWEALGRALTVLTFCLAVSYAVATFTLAFPYDVWIPVVRWSVRAVLLGACWVTIGVLALDRPPDRDEEVRRLRHEVERLKRKLGGS